MVIDFMNKFRLLPVYHSTAFFWFVAVLFDRFCHGVGIVLCMKCIPVAHGLYDLTILLIVICFYRSFLNTLQDLDVNLNCQLCTCLGDFQRIYNFTK
jgi:hypothetical protein